MGVDSNANSAVFDRLTLIRMFTANFPGVDHVLFHLNLTWTVFICPLIA